MNSEKTRHGQRPGRETYFARNTTSSQKKALQKAFSYENTLKSMKNKMPWAGRLVFDDAFWLVLVRRRLKTIDVCLTNWSLIKSDQKATVFRQRFVVIFRTPLFPSTFQQADSLSSLKRCTAPWHARIDGCRKYLFPSFFLVTESCVNLLHDGGPRWFSVSWRAEVSSNVPPPVAETILSTDVFWKT